MQALSTFLAQPFPCRKALREGDHAVLRGGKPRDRNSGLMLCTDCADRIPRKPREKQRDGILGPAAVSYCGSRS